MQVVFQVFLLLEGAESCQFLYFLLFGLSILIQLLAFVFADAGIGELEAVLLRVGLKSALGIFFLHFSLSQLLLFKILA